MRPNKIVVAVSLTVVVAAIAGAVWWQFGPGAKPSGPQGVAHDSPLLKPVVFMRPAPPKSVNLFGQDRTLADLKSPIGVSLSTPDSPPSADLLAGRRVYFEKCVFCHGPALDGRGVHANAYDPAPPNFTDEASIDAMSAGHLFWRIATGAKGIADPWMRGRSAMPEWQSRLSETEIWQVIHYIRDRLAKFKTPDEWSTEQVFFDNCAACHGEKGEGNGFAADQFFPKPRDFAFGIFKYRTTALRAEFPSDEDLTRTIRGGLNGTAMAAWSQRLTDGQITGLIDLIKEFGEWEDTSPKSVDVLVDQLGSSSITVGEKVFRDRCKECHGEHGRGDPTTNKIMMDEWRDRIWARNLTRHDTFRQVRQPEDIFRVVTTGLAGTPMQSHMTELDLKERWSVANFAYDLGKSVAVPTKETGVISAQKVDGELPKSGYAMAWDNIPATTIRIAPNVAAKRRITHSDNDLVSVRAIYNDHEIAIRVDVDDRTYSVPGDFKERRHARKKLTPTADAIAVEFPVGFYGAQSLPAVGPSTQAVMWYWRARSKKPKVAEQTMQIGGSRDPGWPALTTKAEYRRGQWRVVFKRRLAGPEKAQAGDVNFVPGRALPIAFANWDGWDAQSLSRHSRSGWHWLKLEPAKTVKK